MSQANAACSETVCLVCCSAAASVYCCQDDASLCKACSAKIHSANLLAARHTLLPFCAVCAAAPSTVYCRADQAFLCSACDTEAHTGVLASRHERIPASAAFKEGALNSSKGVEEVFAESSSGANSEVNGVKQTEQANEFNDLISLGTDFGVVPVFSPQPELPNDEPFEKQMFGKDFESLDIDAAWLDRLDMGFDFSDILADNSLPEIPSDDAGLVPTLSSSFPEDDFAVPGISMFEEQTPLFSTFSAGVSAPTPAPTPAVPEQAPIRKRKAARRMLEESDEELDEEVEEDIQSDDDDYDVPAAKSRKQSRCLVAAAPRAGAVMEAASGVYFQMPAALITVSAAQAAINRAERIAKCRDKRKNRKFEKTIRYATRKAYAEVRPRIKGRFVKKEELEAYRALHGRGMFDPVPTGEEATVPVM